MSNQAFSVSEDLMVGAGSLYFKRSDDPNGWHHLGNVDEFTIANETEKVDKNSSMNKRRELLASVITSVKPTASITMTEYNPYNLALGLFGTEGAYVQQGRAIASEPYTVPSVPGIIQITDADGNRYMDVKGISVGSSGTPTPTYSFKSLGTASGHATISSDGHAVTDELGGVLRTVINMNNAPLTNIYATVEVVPTCDGDISSLSSLVLKAKIGETGNVLELNLSNSVNGVFIKNDDGDAFVSWYISDDGVTSDPTAWMTLTVTVPNVESFTGKILTETGSDPLLAYKITTEINYDPSGTVVAGKDYVVDSQESRAGIIKIPAGSSLNAGDVIYVNATIPEGVYPTVNGGNAGGISGELLFIGDPNIGGRYNIEGWKVNVTPEGDLTGLIGSDFGTFTLSVDFLADYERHPDCPYFRAVMVGRADGKDSIAGTYDPKY